MMSQFFSENLSGDAGYSVSGLYPNRGNTNLYRVYIELTVAPSSKGSTACRETQSNTKNAKAIQANKGECTVKSTTRVGVLR